ncbi:Glycogen synthase [Bordetella ansorpii]|uniref:Glycogen synthase n=1 Tax=Bordetella ansorpii TaxID=288768 RepID=A0A157R1T1_9BORD|nr:glycosyltransferase family 4 protein [Bordetella ansorpii]SAI51774.1 Glycogen synthase [Bordetella ansorpii]
MNGRPSPSARPASQPGSRTVHIVSRFGTASRGGVERVADLLARSLRADGERVEIIDEARVLPPLLRNPRIAQFVFPVFASVHLSRLRRRDGAFKVISNGSYAAFYPADAVIMHGSASGYVAAMRGRTGRMLGMRLMGKLEVCAMRRSRHVVCVSDALQRYVVSEQGIAPAKCSVAYNGVLVSEAPPAPRFGAGPVRLGFAGRLEYGKGVDFLIDLAQRINGRQDVRLVLAAIGHVPQALRDNPNVDVLQGLGADDMQAFYDRIDVFILPTLFEGFELVTLEALAAGVPVMGRPLGACGLLLERKVPWVARLPDEAGTLLADLGATVTHFRQHADGAAMKAYVKVNFPIEAFCARIKAAAAMEA